MRINTGDLVRVKREVVAEHADGFLGGDFGHHRDVEHGGNIVEQREQAGDNDRVSVRGVRGSNGSRTRGATCLQHSAVWILWSKQGNNRRKRAGGPLVDPLPRPC